MIEGIQQQNTGRRKRISEAVSANRLFTTLEEIGLSQNEAQKVITILNGSIGESCHPIRG
jgi:hypothetical protein